MALMVFAMSIPMFAAYEAEADYDKVAFDVKKADMEIKLDGDLSEYDMFEIELKQSWMSYATSTDDQMAEVKSIKTPLYLAWDETYLYIATTYKPATFSCSKDDALGNIWQESAIQVNVSAADAVDTDRLEYGNALSSVTGKQLSNVWANREGFDYKAEGNYFVKNDGGTLIYETRIAWTDFLKAAPKQGDTVGFCIVWAMGVDAAHAHKQLASGCTGDPGKKAQNFAKITLAAAPERPVEIVEEVTAPATTAPATTAPATTPKAAQTSDMGIIIAISTLLTSGAALLVSKKRK